MKTTVYKPGSRLVSPEADLDLEHLRHPLSESAKPTANQRALEVSIYWGAELIDNVLVASGPVTVGARDSKGEHHLTVCGELPNDQFTVATNHGDHAEISVPTGAKVGLRTKEGEVARNVQLDNGRYSLQLHERIAFKYGALTFIAQFVQGNATMGIGKERDWFYPRVFAMSAMAHGFFVAAAMLTPQKELNPFDAFMKNNNRFAQLILKAPEPEKPRKKLELSGMKGGAKHKGDEGAFGKKHLKKRDTLASKAGAPKVDPNKREEDRKIAMRSGLLGLLKDGSGSAAVSSIFGPGGLGTGINEAMGGLRGATLGDAGGAGGLGSRGTEAGGGGGSLGIGGLRTHGRGRGTEGYGNIDLGQRGKARVAHKPRKTIVLGGLKRSQIGRVIRRNLARFKFCYEKQLNKNPNLAGKVSVYFTIAPNGAVAKASVSESSIGDARVENCATKVMRTLRFPKPKGGGIVVVTYPFIFTSGG